jgi:hypothetical protein
MLKGGQLNSPDQGICNSDQAGECHRIRLTTGSGGPATLM